ncbi:PP_RS20740 family protein [Aureimonas ureilytica]|uniref:PP_RS20740 family protein n=1 Tax=Aureimonas ureilytica TaxID=401562 RepID=UPI003CFBAA84
MSDILDANDDVEATFGNYKEGESEPGHVRPKRTDYAAWHHPVKQRVRTSQWQALVRQLLELRSMRDCVLRYFTLPGPDLLDVRVVADVCTPSDVRIEYFGFDSARRDDQAHDPRFEIESALRQSRKVTDDAVIYQDRLEDIAQGESQASKQLQMRQPFDVVNIDACDHLAYSPPNRTVNLFEALKRLLAHQMDAVQPWLLFITTRAEPHLMAGPGELLQEVIDQNVQKADGEFKAVLADVLKQDASCLLADLKVLWEGTDDKFLKLFSIALTKYLVQFYLSQPNKPADVELKSLCAYRVYGKDADMLALAFQITPTGRVFFEPGQVPVRDEALETRRAIRAANRSRRMRDLDAEIQQDADLLNRMTRESAILLNESNFDLDGYLEWLSKHAHRPILVNREVIA